MSRLYRPPIPLEVKCRVLLRQLGEIFPDRVIDDNRFRPDDAYMKGIGVFVPRGLGALHARLMDRFAELIGCKPEDLRLDHDPALGLREKTGEGKRTVYKPAANDPEHLIYRPHGAEYEGSHDVKTRIRGERGQFSDVALMKRERRRQKRAEIEDSSCPVERFLKSKQKIRSGKTKWPKRSFPKRKKK